MTHPAASRAGQCETAAQRSQDRYCAATIPHYTPLPAGAHCNDCDNAHASDPPRRAGPAEGANGEKDAERYPTEAGIPCTLWMRPSWISQVRPFGVVVTYSGLPASRLM